MYFNGPSLPKDNPTSFHGPKVPGTLIDQFGVPSELSPPISGVGTDEEEEAEDDEIVVPEDVDKPDELLDSVDSIVEVVGSEELEVEAPDETFDKFDVVDKPSDDDRAGELDAEDSDDKIPEDSELEETNALDELDKLDKMEELFNEIDEIS